MGEADAARVPRSKLAKIAAASRTTATKRKAAKSSAFTPNRRLCMCTYAYTLWKGERNPREQHSVSLYSIGSGAVLLPFPNLAPRSPSFLLQSHRSP